MAEDFDSLLELLRRTTDEFGWLQPILDDPDGAALLGGQIRVFDRLGTAVDHNGAQATISGSSGGTPGTSSLTVSRPSSGTTGTIPEGYVFTDPRGCQAFLTVAVAVGSGATSATLPLQTLRQTELVNTEDDPGFAVDLSSAIVSDGAGGVLMAPADFFLEAARVVATTNQALTGTPTIDTVTLGAFDRVLLTGQTDPTQNGLWQLPAVSGAWTRPLDFATSAEIFTGLMVPISQGATHAGQLWQLTTTGPLVLGTTSLTFSHVGLFATVFQTIGPATPILGGAADFLSVHGAERGIYRQPGEGEAPYRTRVRNIPDAVSPIAVADVVQAAAQQPGLPAFLTLEPFDDGADPALKILHGLGSFAGGFLDDPGGPNQHGFIDDALNGDVLLDRRTATNYLEIAAQGFITDPNGEVLFVDDAFLDDPVLGYPDIAGGVPPGVLAALLAIAADVQVKKSGGVLFDIVLDQDQNEVGSGKSAANVFTEVVTMTPPSGTIWAVSEVWAGHDTAAPNASVFHHLIFNLEDGTTIETFDFGFPWSQRIAAPTKRVTSVHGFIVSDGSALANLVVNLKVLQMDL